MFEYFKRLYNQISKLYQIKTHLDKIHLDFEREEDTTVSSDIAANDTTSNTNEKYEPLKQLIFSCGSIYIKFFQWYISKLKANIINDEIVKSQKILKFIRYFEDIFEQCPYHDIEHTKNIFKESMFGIELKDYVVMNTFKEIASGSIGQVYYARRKRDGLEIAIKVKHPNIESDLANQSELISIFKIIQSIKFIRNRYNIIFNIDDFLTDINLQCDFNNEADNCNTFRENFKDSSNYIVFPKIIYQSKDLLISEYIKGEDIANLTDMQRYNATLNFVCFFYQMIFIDNFIHGDLHCKNWKIRQNKNTNTIQLVIYDCGICFKNINTELTSKYWFSLIKYDIKGIIESLKEFITDTNTDEVCQKIINSDTFDNDIALIFEEMLRQTMGISMIMRLVLNFFRSHNIIVHKFLLNFSILICVVEEFLKGNNIFNKDKNKEYKISMFDIINDNQLDIIAFCDVKKCYIKVRDLFALNMNKKFIDYKTNVKNNNINEQMQNENIDNQKLFSTIQISGLKFKTPGS